MKKKSLVDLFGVLVLISVSGAFIYDFNMPENVSEAVVKEPKETTLEAKFITDTKPPVITGEKNWEVELGSKIDVLSGVTAEDDISGSVEVVATKFSTDQVGEQKVTLLAEDNSKNKAIKDIVVNVVAPVVEEIEGEVTVPEAEVVDQVVSEPVYEEAAVVESEPVVSQEPTFSANAMYVGGLEIPYQNAGEGSGQSVIDNNPNVIATWGGAATQSGNDGLNTHFIGHNPGIFSVLFQLGGGETITVTDGSGTPTNYVVSQIFQVDDYGTGISDGQDYMDLLIGTGGGERITLQTCVNDSVNLIVIATAA